MKGKARPQKEPDRSARLDSFFTCFVLLFIASHRSILVPVCLPLRTTTALALLSLLLLLLVVELHSIIEPLRKPHRDRPANIPSGPSHTHSHPPVTSFVNLSPVKSINPQPLLLAHTFNPTAQHPIYKSFPPPFSSSSSSSSPAPNSSCGSCFTLRHHSL